MSLVVLACLSFVSLGLPDAALGVAWPPLREAFTLPQSGMGLVLGAVTVGFILASNAAQTLVARWGIGRLLALSTAAIAVAALGFATAPLLGLLLLAAVVVGLGSGAIDAGLNGYAASNFSARHMNWLHAAYGLGAALGPFIMTAVLAGGGTWRGGYLALAIVAGGFAILFWLRRGSWPRQAVPIASRDTVRGPWLNGRAALQVLAFFIYTGVEVAAGQWCFAVLSLVYGLSDTAAGTWTGLYWTSLFAGRLAVGVVADRLGPDRLVACGVVGMFTGALIFALAPGWTAGLGLVVIGMAAAPVFPMLMTRTARRFDPAMARRLFGLQVSAANLGSLAVPTLGGVVADVLGLAAVPAFLVATALALLLVASATLRPVATAPT